MPITICIVDPAPEEKEKAAEEAFKYFVYVDKTFSTYKEGSEISLINRKEIKEGEWSDDMKTVFALSEKTKLETLGYFDIQTPEGPYDPSGLVKGWSIYNAANLISAMGFRNFYIEAGGDIESRGRNSKGEVWSAGIRDPWSKGRDKIIKTVFLSDCGMATSGTYERGQHIYNPHNGRAPLNEIVSITIIGPNAYEADRFATAAFAMGKEGINFIEQLQGFEGYSVDKNGVATMTSNFDKFTKNNENNRQHTE